MATTTNDYANCSLWMHMYCFCAISYVTQLNSRSNVNYYAQLIMISTSLSRFDWSNRLLLIAQLYRIACTKCVSTVRWLGQTLSSYAFKRVKIHMFLYCLKTHTHTRTHACTHKMCHQIHINAHELDKWKGSWSPLKTS